MLFPSEVWVSAWIALCNADAEFQEAGVGWNGSAGCVIRPAGQPGTDSLYLRLTGRDGQWTDHTLEPNPEVVDGSLFVLSADYVTWRAVIEQKLNPIRAMVQGRVRVSGQLSSVLRWHRSLLIMTQLAGRLETDFIPSPPR